MAPHPAWGVFTEWYVRRALRAWRARSCGIIVGVGAALVVAACGGGGGQEAHGPRGRFPVRVSTPRFPAVQTLAQSSHLVIAVRNSGHRTIPNIAVTLCNVTCAFPAPKGQGTSAEAFGTDIDQPSVASPSRPIWIVHRGPGTCGFSCRNGGQGAGVTAYSNTWALGQLRPGRTARFDWAVTAVSAGTHLVAWQVAAGLDATARAVLADGSRPQGRFAVKIATAAPKSYVGNNGQVVTKP
jgi:hypothetical protein